MNPMKQIVSALFLIVVCLAAACLHGCGTFGNGKLDNPLVATPYQAGRTFVFLDVVTEPIQPEEVKAVTAQVYALAKLNVTGAETLADDFIEAEIAGLYPDATPEFRQVLFNLYDKLTIRLLSQIDGNVELPRVEVLSEFNRGINDALALYKPENP